MVAAYTDTYNKRYIRVIKSDNLLLTLPLQLQTSHFYEDFGIVDRIRQRPLKLVLVHNRKTK